MRHAAYETLNARAVRVYLGAQQKEAVSLALQLFDEPEHWEQCINRYVSRSRFGPIH